MTTRALPLKVHLKALGGFGVAWEEFCLHGSCQVGALGILPKPNPTVNQRVAKSQHYVAKRKPWHQGFGVAVCLSVTTPTLS